MMTIDWIKDMPHVAKERRMDKRIEGNDNSDENDEDNVDDENETIEWRKKNEEIYSLPKQTFLSSITYYSSYKNGKPLTNTFIPFIY